MKKMLKQIYTSVINNFDVRLNNQVTGKAWQTVWRRVEHPIWEQLWNNIRLLTSHAIYLNYR